LLTSAITTEALTEEEALTESELEVHMEEARKKARRGSQQLVRDNWTTEERVSSARRARRGAPVGFTSPPCRSGRVDRSTPAISLFLKKHT
jgi:hypothetical protein